MPFPIDIRTLFFAFAITNLVIAIFLFGFIRITHSRDQLLKLYLIPKILYAIAQVLYGLREIIPAYLSILLANGLLLFAISLEIYCLKTITKPFNAKKLKQQLVITTVLTIFFGLFSTADYHIRVFVNSLILLFLFLQCAIPLITDRSQSTLQYIAGILYGITAILVAYRGINTLFFRSHSSLLDPNTIQLIILFSIYLVSIFNTFLLFLISKEIDSKHLREQNSIIASDNQLLNKLNTTKNKFMSIISHDLRGPLGNIENLSFLLQDQESDFSDAEKTKYLNVIQRSASQANRLLNNLLFWSLSESDSISFKPTQFSINKLMEEAITLLSPLAMRKHLLIRNEITDDLKVFADIEMVNTILRNLISNAIKYSHPKSSITLKCYPTENHTIKTEVIDQGVGLSAHQISEIFLSGDYTSEKGTLNETGTGLGLKLCLEFAKKNEGTLGVESTVGKGSCFWLTLPAVSPQSPNE